MSRNALGRGLSALLSDEGPIPQPKAPPQMAEGQAQVPVGRIRPNRFQPRQELNQEAILELADSIKVHGLLQPIVVSYDAEEDEYELIAGERRLEAAKHLGMKTIPAVVQDVDDESRFELGLVENIQREDLNPIEEARAYELLMEKFALTQEQAAHRLGRKRATIANSLRLLKLPEDIRVEIASGSLSAGHAKALAAIEDEEQLREILRRLREGTYTVRQTEAWVREMKESQGRRRRRKAVGDAVDRDPNLRYVEEAMQDLLGTKVRIRPRGASRGRFEIEYYSQDDFQRVLDVLGVDAG